MRIDDAQAATLGSRKAAVLWTVQTLLALVFLFAGGVKLVMPIEAMQAGMKGSVVLPGGLLPYGRLCVATRQLIARDEGRAPSTEPRVPSYEYRATSTEPRVPSHEYRATSFEPRVPSHEYRATSAEPRVPSTEPRRR
jgi:hypothetical protein